MATEKLMIKLFMYVSVYHVSADVCEIQAVVKHLVGMWEANPDPQEDQEAFLASE